MFEVGTVFIRYDAITNEESDRGTIIGVSDETPARYSVRWAKADRDEWVTEYRANVLVNQDCWGMIPAATTPTNSTVGGVIWVCGDCTLAHHGYDEHELGRQFDREPWSLWESNSEITAGMALESHAYGCNPDRGECSCETQSFSSRDCEGCGSPLAGNRHAFTWWEKVATNA